MIRSEIWNSIYNSESVEAKIVDNTENVEANLENKGKIGKDKIN